MIWYFVLLFFSYALDIVLFWLPKVTELPFGADAVLLQAVRWGNGLVAEVPLFEAVRETFLWVLGFEITLLVLTRILRVIR